MTQTFKDRYGYPLWLPFVFIGLMAGIVVFIITGIYTGDWRWLLGALACYAAIASKRP